MATGMASASPAPTPRSITTHAARNEIGFSSRRLVQNVRADTSDRGLHGGPPGSSLRRLRGGEGCFGTAVANSLAGMGRAAAASSVFSRLPCEF